MSPSLNTGEQIIDQDDAPPHVLAAVRRLQAAMRRGDRPGSGTTIRDGRILRTWLQGQDRKHPPRPAPGAATDTENPA